MERFVLYTSGGRRVSGRSACDLTLQTSGTQSGCSWLTKGISLGAHFLLAAPVAHMPPLLWFQAFQGSLATILAECPCAGSLGC